MKSLQGSLFVGVLAASLFGVGALTGCKPDTTASGTTGSDGEPTTETARPEPKGEGNAATGDEIYIGLVASQNGALRPWGADCVNGARLAVEEFNKQNLLGGKKVVLRVQDSASDPVQGKNAAEKLVSDGVIGLLGEVSSGITAQIADVAFESGVPNVAVGATKTDLTAKSNNIFRVCYTDDLQGPVMAWFAYNDLNLRKMAMMTDNKQPYSTYLSESFAKKFEELGGEIVDDQRYETGNLNFASQITNLKQKNPDGIFLSGYFNEVGPIARQIHENGMTNVKLLGGDGWDSAEILQSGGDAIVGGYFCNHYNSEDDRPEVSAFLNAWKAAYNNSVPGTTMGALGYDAAALMCDAIRRMHEAGTEINSANLTAELANTEGYRGVTGDITLKGAGGDPAKRAIIVELTRQGQKFAKAYEPSDIPSS